MGRGRNNRDERLLQGAPESSDLVLRECERLNEADRHDGIMEWLEDVSVFDEPDSARDALDRESGGAATAAAEPRAGRDRRG
jgi:hypothetical protein